MIDYKKYIEPKILEILEQNHVKKEKFEKSLEAHIKMCQNRFSINEIDEFISQINKTINEEKPELNKYFVLRSDNAIVADDTEVFAFDKNKDLTFDYVNFLNKKEEIENKIKSLFDKKTNIINTFNKFIDDEVYTHIISHPDIINNPFFKEIESFNFSVKYIENKRNSSFGLSSTKKNVAGRDIKLLVTFSYNKIIQNPFEIFFEENMSKDKKDKLKFDLFYKFKSVLNNLETDKLKLVEQRIKQDLPSNRFKSCTMGKWSEPKKYWFNSHYKMFYVSVLYLEMEAKEKNELIQKSKNVQTILNDFGKHDFIFRRDLILTDDNNSIENYSFDKKIINLNFDTNSEEYKNLVFKLNDEINKVLDFDNNNVLPTEDIITLRRYFIKKIDDYQVEDDRYQIYQFRGRKNRIYIRGFKNGILLSTNQLMKAYKKRKKQKEQILSKI